MDLANIRQKLHEYVDKGDDKLLKLMYAVVKEYKEEDDFEYEFSDEEIKLFEERRAKRLSGESETFNWRNKHEVEKKAHSVRTKEDFLIFIEYLLQDLNTNPSTWENKSLDGYLQAIKNWTEDMEGYYVNNSLPVPQNIDWKVFADILIAAKIYE